jgi:Protein of unknown function (DUF1326)
VTFRVRGAYLESCNCDAVCPCRMVGGIPGGRSTHGTCFGLLTWRIDDGKVEDVDVSGLAVALVFDYDDDEADSPWTLTLHVDSRGTAEQRGALAALFLSGLGGSHTSQLPWIRKQRHLIAVEASRIDVTLGKAKVGDEIRLEATRVVPVEEPVACGIPGYDRPGRELYADELRFADGLVLTGNCAYASDFDYVSA